MHKYPSLYPAVLMHNVKKNYKYHHSTQRCFSTEGTKVNLYLFITRGINTDKTRTLVSTYYKRPDQKESLKASPQVLQSVQEPSYLKQASHGNLILFLLKFIVTFSCAPGNAWRGGNRDPHKPPSIRLMKLSNGRRLVGRKWLDSRAGEGRPKACCNITETWQESHKLPI